MAAKRVQISRDNGVVYRTIPGSSGEFNSELATVNDTVFGQTFESNEVSIGTWNVSGNGYMKGVGGYVANLKKQGVATVMAGQATTSLGGNAYQITDPTRRILDYFTPITTTSNAVDSTANIASIDYLNGIITFTGVQAGPVLVSGKYMPTVSIARGKGFTLTQTAAEIDTTDYETARANGGWRTYQPGLRTVGLEVSGIYDVANGAQAALAARQPLVVEVSPDNSSTTIFRGYFKHHSRGQSGDVGALEEETVNFGLWVPDGSLLVRPFGWYFGAGTALNQAIQDAIGAWQSEVPVKIRYQHDPALAGSGNVGDAIVTECTLTNALEGLNEFRFGFRGSGAPAAV